MKIRALRVAELGLFREPVAVEGLSGSLDVLVGANELGKSTLFRAIGTALQTSHKSTGQLIDALAPRGQGGTPRIEVDFEAGGRRWRIAKQYGNGRKAELSDLDAGRIIARGSDAETELARLLGTASAGAGAGRFSLLWVAQQHSLRVPAPDYDHDRRKAADRGERATLRSAIAAEIDAVAGGQLTRNIAARVKEEINTYLQPKKKLPKKGSRFDDAVTLRQKLTDERAHAASERAKAAARLDRLADLVTRQRDEASPSILAAKKDKAQKAAAAAAEAEKSATALAHALSREETARLAHEQARDRLQRYGKALDEWTALIAEQDRLNTEASQSTATREDTERRLALVEQDIRDLEQKQQARVTAAARERERRALQMSIVESRKTRDSVAEALKAIVRLEEALEENPATPKRLRLLTEASQQAAIAAERAAMPAAADLAFALHPEAASRVHINGKPAAQDGKVPVDRITTVEIDGIGRFTIVPPDADERVARQTAAQRAGAALARTLEELGVKEPSQAQALADARAKLSDELLALKSKVSAVAPSGLDAFDVAIATEERMLAALDESLAAIAAGDSSDRPADTTEHLAAARATRDAVLAEQARLDNARIARTERHRQIERHLKELDTSLGAAAARPAERDRLAAIADEKSKAVDVATRERLAQEAAAPSADHIRALLRERDDAAADHDRADAAAARMVQEIAALEGEIKASGEAEIGPNIARLAGEIAALDREIAHHEHQIAALELLADTLASVETDSRSKFLAPVMRRLEPYLSQVFPDAEVVFNESFGVEALVRRGSNEPVDLLSDGTREQLAVLVRLGFARLLAESGNPAPVILDDALVYSDDARIARMFSALETAASQHQVIVFTCHAATFASLGGTRLQIVPWTRS